MMFKDNLSTGDDTIHLDTLPKTQEAQQPPNRPKTALNVIVPIGGIGSRFAKEGYRHPKPLINIVGRPMILWLIENLSLSKDDTLWLAVNEEVDDEFRIGQLVAKSFPKVDFRLLRLRHQTKGASETLYVVTQRMSEDQLQRRTVSLDCDTIYWADILQMIRELPAAYGGCFYFPDEGNKPIFSYIKTESKDGVELITDIQEKKAISNKANTGAYVFSSGRDLRLCAAKTIDLNATRSANSEIGEYYTSQTIALMILDNEKPFIGIHLTNHDFSCVGTPEQLQVLLSQLKKTNDTIPMKKRRFCFDLDSTLVGVPARAGDYSSCPPIKKNIDLVQQLYKAGHYIIIQTARRMKTHNGNVGSVIADVGPVTFAQLAAYDIPFHDIHFGKPYADVYVDDLAVHASLDTMREIGWLLEDSPLSEADSKKTMLAAGMIAARDFNDIQMVGDKVIKSSKYDTILGEAYFYSHLPAALLPMFPQIYAVDYWNDTSTYSITMENRKGITFSHLLVGRSITTGRLLSMLEALHKIHTTPNTEIRSLQISPELETKFAEHSLDLSDGRINIYANYGQKLRSRYSENAALYAELGPLSAELFNRLNEFLDTYEAEGKGVHTEIIHGDPVFSNIILSDDEKLVSFIDVRCQLENTLTPEGDLHYDLGKVLQSLLGYDHILFLDAQNSLGQDSELLDQADKKLLAELQDVFWEFLETKYEVKIHRKTLLRITASLFFSLIPLHAPRLGSLFLQMCKSTLDMAGQIGHGLGTQTSTVARMTVSRSSSYGPSDDRVPTVLRTNGNGAGNRLTSPRTTSGSKQPDSSTIPEVLISSWAQI